MAGAEEIQKRNFLSERKIISICIADEMKRVLANDKWTSGDRHVESLIKGEGINVALVMLKSGARLDEHRTRAPITVQVIDGKIALVVEGERSELAAGSILAIDRELSHAVEALSDSAFILTVGGESR